MSSSEYSAVFLAEDRRQPAIIGMVVVTTLSLLVVLVRLYARGYLIHELGWDDLTIVIAQLVSWIVLGLSIMVIHYGSGQHLAALMNDPETLVHMYKWLVGAQLVYMFNLWLCRVSGIAFYARLNQMPRFILYLRISFAFVTFVYVAQTLIVALQCIPLAALWGGAEGKCMGSVTVFISTSGLTIACDLLVLLLPINIIFSLTSILRMVSMIVALRHPEDATWYFSVVMVWSTTETSAAIIALSLPALRALFGFWSRKRSTMNHSDSDQTRTIGLQTISRSAKHLISDEHHIHQATFDVDWGTNRSQETLWGVKDGKVQVEDTARVGVGKPSFR
ncbi:uncharacterized protein N7500_000956 [Penicillium coprophilum]|uniref:uncharacterized protein n=1 Tax=Penicillium coprophilum TaxID=36646 RepID=UPI00238BE9B6|nr:uncharacterized protein N7500_000956 [Penicillium coprophilum]KAJ5178257.1 hypothetical protein N7500_000956 [Penicillium coprophilum]